FAQDAAAASVTGGPTVSCTTRTYVFDKNGRRTSRTTTNRSEADCAATGTTVTTTAGGYDTADRPTTGAGGVGSYVYDPFGRQTTIPAADAPNPAGGAVTLAYFDDDLPQAVTQGGTSTTFTLDAAGRGGITTEIEPAGPYYFAEDYHQGYLAKNPAGYCGIGGTGVVCPIGLGVGA
ncbi:MAG: peptide-methionine (S)-S-oxide reductase, partial [Bordetella sp.]|nr:peptide-methionine (S)-S-oxide reductase [Bordetella sp.]